jgi:hypothetical protein
MTRPIKRIHSTKLTWAIEAGLEGRETGLEWLAPDLRNLAIEADANNASRKVPAEAAAAMPAEGCA